MQRGIIALLDLFETHVPDTETIEWVRDVAVDEKNWPRGHQVFSDVRDRSLAAIRADDSLRMCQHSFEEVCLQALFNETNTDVPFDSCSPYWIVPNALELARALGISADEVAHAIRGEGAP